MISVGARIGVVWRDGRFLTVGHVEHTFFAHRHRRFRQSSAYHDPDQMLWHSPRYFHTAQDLQEQSPGRCHDRPHCHLRRRWNPAYPTNPAARLHQN